MEENRCNLGNSVGDAKSYYGEATIIQGPTKLVLISVKSGINDRNKIQERIDQLLEKKEEAHKYIGNYDSTVKFHYDSESAKEDITSERAVKILINSYLMITVMIVDMIIFYTMCQMELKEIILRERFLKNLGMSGKERRKVYRKEICFYYVSPTCIMLAAMVLFLRAVLRARMISRDHSRNVYTNGRGVNSWCTSLKNAVCCGSISGIFHKGRDER